MLSQSGQWRQYKDVNGRVYLHNEATNETKWLWEKYTDHKTKRDYYHNVLTGETRWAEELQRPEVAVRAVMEPRVVQAATPMAMPMARPVEEKKQVETRRCRYVNKDEVEEIDPSGRVIIYNRRTKRSRYADEGVTVSKPQETVRMKIQPDVSNVKSREWEKRNDNIFDRYQNVDAERQRERERMPDRGSEPPREAIYESNARANGGKRKWEEDPGRVNVANGQQQETNEYRRKSEEEAKRAFDEGMKRGVTTSEGERSPARAEGKSVWEDDRGNGKSLRQGSSRSRADSDGITKSDGGFFCEPCNRWLKDHFAMSSHCKGKKHGTFLQSWIASKNAMYPEDSRVVSNGATSTRQKPQVNASWNVEAGKPSEGREPVSSEAFVDSVLNGSYPTTLKEWIVQSRRAAKSPAQRVDVNAELQHRISRAVQSGKVWLVDWGNLEPAQGEKAHPIDRALSWTLSRAKESSGYGPWEKSKSSTTTSTKKTLSVNDGYSKRTASAPYHDLTDAILPEAVNADPTSEAGKALCASVTDDALSLAFRRCKSVWSKTRVFAKQEGGTIVGKSLVLEKEFLRMNNFEADPENVRPLETLEKSLDFILHKYRYVNALWPLKPLLPYS